MTVPLSALCELIVDCEHKTAPVCEEGYPSIRTPNVGRGRLLLEGANRVDESTYRYWTKRAIPRPGDLIVAREAPVGNVAIIIPGQTVCLGQRTVLLRPNREIVDSQYLTYFLLAGYAQAYFRSCSIGSTVPHLNMKDIRSLPVPGLPNLDVQRRIAGILSAYDDLIEVNTRRIAILEEMARRLFDEWFVVLAGGQDSDVGRIGALGDLATLTGSSISPQAQPDRRYAHFSIPAYDEARLPATESGRDIMSNKLQFTPPAVLVSKLNPRIPRVWRVAVTPDAPSICSTEFMVLSPRTPAGSGWLTALLTSPQFGGAIRGLAQGTSTSHQRAKPDDVMALPVVIPGEEQIEIADRVLAAKYDFMDTLRAANRNLRAARDLLLPKLISGEIDLERAERGVEREAAE